jgi:transcription antitermination factor NusG
MEFKAAAELRRSGYATWLPFERVTKFYKRPGPGNGRRPHTTNKAYYERYVFVGLKYSGQDLGAIYDTTYVSTVVKSPMTGHPLRIPDAVMDRIAALGDGTEFIREVDEVSAKSRKKYTKGDEVTIVKGTPLTPFEEITALVERDIGGKELWVEVEVFGGKRRVAVKPDQVEAKAA